MPLSGVLTVLCTVCTGSKSYILSFSLVFLVREGDLDESCAGILAFVKTGEFAWHMVSVHCFLWILCPPVPQAIEEICDLVRLWFF